MIRIKNILLVLGTQYIISLLYLWTINTREIMFTAISFNQVLLILSSLLLTILLIIYIAWLDRKFIEELTDREAELREKTIEEDMDVRNHETFRDLQMIKVMYKKGELEALDAYITKEIHGS